MRALHRTQILLLLLSSVATARADAASQLTSAPHFLVLGDRDRIVLFSDGPVAGALADQQSDGSVEVVIPRLVVDEAIAGREFDDAAGGGDGKIKVRLSNAGQGDVRVRIASARPVSRVHAFASNNPSRLVIDLLHGGAAVAEREERAPVAVAAAKPAAAPAKKPTTAGEQGEVKPDKKAVRREPDPPAAGKGAPPALAAAPEEMVGPPREQAGPPREEAEQRVLASAAKPAAVTAPPALPAAESTEHAPVVDVAADGAADGAPTAAPDETLVCRWRRASGIAYCAPDPKAGVYLADLGTASLAGLLDRGRGGPSAVPLPRSGPTEAYLNADVVLIRAARDGWILPAVSAYEQALRTHPEFVDARRARANLALVFHALGFAPELDRMSRVKGDAVAPFAGVLLADLVRELGERRDTAPLLAAGDRAGGITACLAERVRANAAAAAGRREAFPEAFAALAKVCPRTIVEDPETAWLRARAMILGGEAARAAGALAAIEADLPRRQRALLLADLVRAHDAAANAAGARSVEERLAAGSHGRRAARAARVALATRDAAEGKLAPGEHRFADLPIEDAVQTRERADLIAASELLRGGNEVAALGLVTERKLDARRLAVADQILLARALRRVGLLEQSQRILAGIGTTAPARLPDDYFEELGAHALARDDAAAALAVAEQWQAARSGAAPIGAVALRTRARAAKGDAQGAAETLREELAVRDPDLARAVAVELAAELLSADPTLALRLARGALDPSLPPLGEEREAAALRALAEAAEATGDPLAAREAFARLAQEHGGDPAAAGAAYRAARLASAVAEKPAAKEGAAAAPAAAPAPAQVLDDDPLARRLAAVGRIYDEVVAGVAPGAKP